MGVVRQAASGLIYGMVSLLLVIGSLSLALAQGGGLSASVATFTPLPSSTPTARPSRAATASDTVTVTSGVQNSATPPPRSPTSPGSTSTAPAAAATATRKLTCGAPYGWVQDYIVEPGDTLFRIATRYGVRVDALQSANCRSNTVIFVGERLWVPYPRPAATELTIIPTFPTPTEPATATETASPSSTPATPGA